MNQSHSYITADIEKVKAQSIHMIQYLKQLQEDAKTDYFKEEYAKYIKRRNRWFWLRFFKFKMFEEFRETYSWNDIHDHFVYSMFIECKHSKQIEDLESLLNMCQASDSREIYLTSNDVSNLGYSAKKLIPLSPIEVEKKEAEQELNLTILA